MNELTEFLLKSSIILIAFYFGYWFLLRKTTHFMLNRFYLLAGLFTSLLIPFMHFSLPEEYPPEIFVTLDSIEVSAVYVQAQEKTLDFAEILRYIYWSGVFVLSFRLLFQFYLLIKLYLSAEKEVINGNVLLKTNKNNAAFSFFHLIFIHRDLRNSDEFTAVLRHEIVHVRQKHSVDILFAELLMIVLWFNPFVWLYLKSIKANHEFLADDGVVRNGFSANRYLEILFGQSTGLHLSLANNFNQSLTFKRLNMMKKIRSHKLTQLKVLIALPVIIAMVIFVSCSKELLDVKAENNQEVKEFEPQINKNQAISGDEVFFIVEEMPQFPGGELGLRKYIAMNVKYPQEARKKNIQGKVYVRFIVTKTGAVDSVTVARKVDPVLDAEAVRVVSTLPKWQAGKQKGVPVNVWYTVPISFRLENVPDNQKSAEVGYMQANPKNNSDELAVTVVALGTESANKSNGKVYISQSPAPEGYEAPEFKGGYDALQKFIAMNIKYPEEARNNNIEGTVNLLVTVKKDGTIGDILVLHSVNTVLEAEAKRVVQLTSGNWTPGKEQGEIAEVKMAIPVNFSLK